MRNCDKRTTLLIVLVLASILAAPSLAAAAAEMTIVLSSSGTPRVACGGNRLKEAMTKIGLSVTAKTEDAVPEKRAILVGFGPDDPLIKKASASRPLNVPPGSEAFLISTDLGRERIVVAGRET